MEGRALGKGLSALIPEKRVDSSDVSEKVSYIETGLIRNNSLQPRLEYPEDKMQELIQSIKEKGILQPILVRRIGNDYEVVAGERRLRAARNLKLEKVPAIIKNLTNNEALVIALIENIQRENLNPIEEAKAYQRLIQEFGHSHERIAQAVGKDRSTISNSLRLLSLETDIQKAVISGQISMGHARALLGIENSSERLAFFKEIIAKEFSVRRLEETIKLRRDGVVPQKTKSKNKSHDMVALEENLQRSLGTKVLVFAKKKKGKIVIEYYSLSDLDRIIKIINPD